MGIPTNQEQPFSVREMIVENQRRQHWPKRMEKIAPKLLFTLAALSVLVTLGILFTLLFETIEFFRWVSIVEFVTSKEWLPWNEEHGSFGVAPLVTGTLLTTGIAMLFAVPIGLASAIYLSEYASERTRRIIKPALEVLAGIPTIVYGFFALTIVTPLLQNVIPDLEIFNALSPGLVMGIMIIPMIASLSEDAMSAVPNSIREGALALGATKLEVALKVVLPAAASGVIASVILGISRAVGETMIVAVAGGSSPEFTFDVTKSIQTLTAYIVQVTTGDAGYGTTIYYSIYAVGMTLFLFTLVMNVLAQYISRRFREEY
ncbi:phosphate ABC transporter permease subunit PstC [Geobacillus thermodenitrificans]|jgi:phosphate transport system permease protein|uniref:Phosphate transport system permease protein n=1 Tax=Geobacillus thermodenitrificans TaxID=33940 RepID=A0ABY9Q8Z6_GEOTD|nr:MULTISPECIES: phosphate ABC transporter permease subunit PstC [Geobacillus]ARP43487.1 Phosphate transport system permease protein PstC [Geobacillus thermodenitrificans]ATO38439.1 phosphate ABC transporter permease subunit PstC [Geobacillus thermodenitrificans]KQB92623.1 phosphate ABC transporter permease [Geobacillus sp. PA-3]MED3716100.1 phosphate ABC transporter permease subunit PstC [Geobacillus thermodenitrificans]MED3904285.1 phosphate ABC transporter permease subunit PstC [Geobacillus